MSTLTALATRDRKAFELARQYLLALDGITPAMVNRHVCPPLASARPAALAELYERLLESAQNSNMRSGVIGKAIGGVERLGSVLCDFEPVAVVQHYKDDPDRVLDTIVARLRPAGKVRRGARSLWPKYCRTILSAARFMSDFRDANDFYQWVDFFDRDDRARLALPLLLKHRIDGIGFPLACDFLKELGYAGFAKPDVHLKRILVGLGLSSSAEDGIVFDAVARVAHHCVVTLYEVDKLFWLIGSGNFYLDSVQVGRHGNDFIEWARRRLK